MDWRLRATAEVQDLSVDLRFETTAGGHVRVLGTPFRVGAARCREPCPTLRVWGSGDVLHRGTPNAADSRE